MTTVNEQGTEGGPMPERAELLADLRTELRSTHRGLTEAQVDLIAEVAVEVRLKRMQMLGASSERPARRTPGRGD